jgi:polyribonucleotide nucleotidyltransferase
VRVVNFGAFVEILPGVEGLLHISEIEDRRIAEVRDVLDEGDETLVKVIDIDAQGRVRLSRRAAIRERDGGPPPPDEGSSEPVGVGERGERGRDEGGERHRRRGGRGGGGGGRGPRGEGGGGGRGPRGEGGRGHGGHGGGGHDRH